MGQLYPIRMPNTNKLSVNLMMQQFLSNGSGYMELEDNGTFGIKDSFLPWETPVKFIAEREESDLLFVESLTKTYGIVGPIEWKGQTVPVRKPVDAEVGDDHVCHTDAPMLFIAELVTAEQTFSIKLSISDTFVSSRYANYSESYILKPDNIAELFHPGIKPGEDSIFMDIAKIRTVLPVCSMRQKHSDTIDGKASLLGKQGIYKTELCGFEVTIARCIQVMTLGLFKEKKFPFSPTFIGGYGCPPLFESNRSMVRCFENYRGGVYYNLLAGICYGIYNTKNGFGDTTKKFLSSVKGNAESWQDWYKFGTKYTPDIKPKIDPEHYLDDGFIGKVGKNELWDSAANRLISAGIVCTDTQLAVHEHMEILTKILLSPENSGFTRLILEREKQNQKSTSVFNTRFIREVPFLVPSVLTDEMVQDFIDLSLKGNYHLRHILSGESIFDRSVLDSIKQSGPCIVNMQMTTKKGLNYPLALQLHLPEEDEEFYLSLLDYLKGGIGITEVSRVLIEDDPFLVEIARDWAVSSSLQPLKDIKIMVITTEDARLCQSINGLFPQIVVVRISPKRDYDSIVNIKSSLKASWLFADLRFFDDEGSVAYFNAMKAKKKIRENTYQKVKFTLKRIINPFTSSQRRLKDVPVVDLLLKPDGIFDQAGLLSNRYDVPRVSFKRTISKFNTVDEFEYRRSFV